VIGRGLKIAIAVLGTVILVMALYLVHLRRNAETVVPPPQAQPMVPPSSGPAQQITIYVPNDEDGSLRAATVSSALPSDNGERARLALQALIAQCMRPDSRHPLGEGSAVQDVFLMDENSAVVNLNAQFVANHRSGIEVEWLTVESMVLTLKAQLPLLTRVRFLVDGNSPESLAGHIALGGWLDVGLVSEAAARQGGGAE
jgi:spore germination protein GerM